jgi:hypothetical protein
MTSEMQQRQAALADAYRHERAGELDAARTILERSLEAGREDPLALELLAAIHHRQGRYDDALASYRRYLEHHVERAEHFDSLYEAGLQATTTSPVPFRRRDRFRSLVGLIERTRSVRGETAECGCFRGLSSFLICSTLRSWSPDYDGSGHHVFDSFQGLSEPTLEDEVPTDWPGGDAVRLAARAGSFAATLEQVRHNLAAFRGICYYPGWIPLSFRDLAERRYRFVHVDVDLYDPTYDCLNYFFPRLVPGGLIVCDDYNWPGARNALEDFCAAHGTSLDVTPHDQAVITAAR